MIKRTLQGVLEQYIGKGKAILLIGARQVGKSTLFHMLTDSVAEVMFCFIRKLRNKNEHNI